MSGSRDDDAIRRGGVPADALVRDLRREIDELRLENQRLQASVSDLSELTYSVPHAAMMMAWRLRRRLQKAMVRRRDEKDFRPYHVVQPQAVRRDRRRVLHAIGNFYTGGSARLVVDLYERLGDRYEQEVVALQLPGQPAYVGIPLEQSRLFTSRRQALALLRSKRPDLLHVHFLGKDGNQTWNWSRHLIEAAGDYGCRVVENVNIPVLPFMSPAVDRYVFVSDYVLARFAPADGTNVTIYPGSDLETFSRTAPYPPPDEVVGMIYRLERDKLSSESIDPLIEAVRQRPGSRGLVVGGGILMGDFKERVARAGLADRFTFTGYVSYDDLPGVLERIAVFVTPVHTESFGHIAVLAMGMQIPLAGYAVGAIPEIIGDSALLAPPGDSAQLGRIVADLLADPERRRRIGAANRRRAVDAFSVEAMIAGYAALYGELLDAKQS